MLSVQIIVGIMLICNNYKCQWDTMLNDCALCGDGWFKEIQVILRLVFA